MAAQQGQQWCVLWLAQLRQFIQQLCSEEHAQRAKDIVLGVATSIQGSWQDIQLQFHNTQWNAIDLCHQFKTLCVSKGIFNRSILFLILMYSLLTITNHKYFYSIQY